MTLTKDEQSMLLGKNSYSTVVKEIIEKIQKAEADTLVGSELLKEVYSKLNESITPLLTLKPFITGAEKIAGDDVKLGDLLKFLKKSITGNADLNYLINLCKEEHFAEMTRLNHPSPQATIKDIEDEFNQPSSVIEEGIKSGIFDNLKSNLLNKIKNDLDVTPDKKLNENALFSGNLVKYSPIGIRLEDLENNRMVILTESEVLSFDRITKDFSKVDESSINIPVNHSKLMNALNSCIYSPENKTFKLNENWDFSLLLKADGNVTINDKNIPKEKIKTLLLESVQAYVMDPLKVKNFNKINYLNAADNFIALMENFKQLVILDTLEVIKNLNENKYIIFDKKQIYENTPRIISSSENKQTQMFESYGNMLQHINENVFTDNISNLFESQLISEKNIIAERNEKIISLNEEQKLLNENIGKVRNLKRIAEENSPAMDKLNEQEKILDDNLKTNIFNLNHFKNEFKIR